MDEHEAKLLTEACDRSYHLGRAVGVIMAEPFFENRIDEANRELIKLRRLAIGLGYHYAMSLPADSWEDRVMAVVKDVGLLKAIRDEVDATADKHAEWR